ncbi:MULTISPECIES: XRE family transcriptional regulator [unclassified Clostridium]|uniref:helix-turn-helix domain-containing protein n=1 Tax=unclassified Clostridium TaxID=2614128 RepID=UPI000E8F353D|nr:DNA-binding protein [Clostridium sp.]
MNKIIGSKIKELRTNKKMTLKELSEKTSLSTGFLSQLERGLTSIATDSLLNIAEALDVELSYFLLSTSKRRERFIQKSYERDIYKIDNALHINYVLSNNPEDKTILPRLIEILPTNTEENLNTYQHEGEEFIYVLEGIITLFINDEKQYLYPGDSAHFKSSINHNYANYTNKICKILVASVPNPAATSKSNII